MYLSGYGLGVRYLVGDGLTDKIVGSFVGPDVRAAYGERVRMLVGRVVGMLVGGAAGMMVGRVV